jgi:hypothetical protein
MNIPITWSDFFMIHVLFKPAPQPAEAQASDPKQPPLVPHDHMLKFIQDLCTIGPKKCQSSENHNPNSEEQDHRALTLRGISREGIDKHLAQRNHLGPRSQQTKKG